MAQTAPSPVALDPEVHFHAYFEFKCNGVHFGKLGIALDQQAGSYSGTSDITTTGLLKIFVPHQSHTTVSADGADFQYPSIRYQSDYRTRKKKKHVEMVFTDGIPSETLVPPENPAKRPPVPVSDKAGSHDPLSFILQSRRMLHEAMARGAQAFQLKFYDGRRLTLITYTIEGTQAVPYGNGMRDSIRVGMRRELLAGFTESEKEDYSDDEPTIYAYFSNDRHMMPIRLETHVWFGQLTAELEKECTGSESCLLTLKP